VTPSEFQGHFPDGDFDTLDGEYIQKFLDLAVPRFNVARWMATGKYSEGLALCVAHKIVMSKTRAARGLLVDSGNVSEKHVGPVGQSINSDILNKQVDDPFLLTSYGRDYAALRDRVGLGGAVGQ
jgi:hypothetical protein